MWLNASAGRCYNVPVPPARTYPPELVVAVAELYEEGMTIEEVAAALRSTRKIVWKLMVRNNIPRRPASKRIRTLAERFWEKVDRRHPEICWSWLGAKTPQGYGKINLGRNGAGYDFAHRVSWKLANGPLPADRPHLDHLCRNPGCVNPAHLEPVTPRENIMRGQAPSILLHLAGVCARGHPRSESCLRKGTNHVVYCRTCRREDRARA